MAEHAGRSWRLRMASLRDSFADSLFLHPALIMLAGIALAVSATIIDDRLGHDAEIPLTLSMSSNAATWLLSTVAGAMITTVGVVFSLTVVSLQLASDQFSPRVMRSFIRDRLSQRVIGLLVGTFFYCVLVLPNVSGETTDPAPQISLTIAVVLTLITVIGIIIHLDHLAHGLQVGNVARLIADEGQRVAEALDTVPADLEKVDISEYRNIPHDAAVIPATGHGWISQVDNRQLLRAAPPGAVIRMETRVGAYIHAGEPLLTVWPAPPERNRRELAAAIEVTDTRRMLQDVDFAVRQLVDIGLRALGPDINDPTTAIEVTLRLGGLLRTVLATPLPPPALRDREDRVLVQPWNLSHEEYIAHSFDQLRQDGVDHTEVAAALLRILRMLMIHVEEEDRLELVPALEHQRRMLLDSLEKRTDLHPGDLARLQSLVSGDTDPADHSRHHG